MKKTDKEIIEDLRHDLKVMTSRYNSEKKKNKIVDYVNDNFDFSNIAPVHKNMIIDSSISTSMERFFVNDDLTINEKNGLHAENEDGSKIYKNIFEPVSDYLNALDIPRRENAETKEKAAPAAAENELTGEAAAYRDRMQAKRA